MKAKGEQSILYLIWHLLPDFPGVASSHIQKRITQRTLSLDGKRGSRATTFIRATGNTILLSSFLCAFVLLSASKRGGWMRERHSRFRHPMCQSKCPFKNLRSRKKRREDFKRKDDDIFYALLNSLFRELFFPLLWFVLLLRLKIGRRELDGGRCERWRGLLAR